MTQEINPEENTEKHLKKQRQNIISLYLGLFISGICNFIPLDSVQVFGMVFFLVLLITSYIYRAQAEQDSLQHSHASYIIKVLWAFSLFIFLAVITASFLTDNTLIHDTMDKAKSGVLMNEEELKSIMSDYIQINLWVFIVTLGPCIGYFVYRLGKGLRFARNNMNAPHLKNRF